MLRKIRQLLAALFFICISLLFLDFTGVLHGWLHWLAKVQFLPALLALNVGVVVALVLLTLVLGRVYCSIICPLGVLQDVVARAARLRPAKRKMPYRYSPAISWLRYAALGVFIVGFVAGVAAIPALLDPYSAYGRMMSSFALPVWQWGNNLLAAAAERMDSYAFHAVDVWLKSAAVMLVAALTFIVIAVLAWRGGRTYCNTICPVGTVLGFLARFSVFRIAIDADKCNNCSLCSRHCKASCIDYKAARVDDSRCVACMNCLDKCKKNAIGYKLRYAKPAPAQPAAVPVETTAQATTAHNSRRGFLITAATLATTSMLKAQEKGDGGLAVIVDKKVPKRSMPIVPAGAYSLRNLNTRCTACQLCVSACPNGVLRPSTNLSTFMQPELSFERGYCRPECTACSEVCPTGAIGRVTKEEKSSIQIGHAVWIKENCVVITHKKRCNTCARRCPTGAIKLVAAEPGARRTPIIDVERCIGCGACENLCPARPFSALYVEGHAMHRTI